MGFRIIVKLSKYFTDERSSCYIYVNDNINLVNDLEGYLSDLFNLEGNYCLLKESSLLPSCENIRVLQENDIISVIPLAERFIYNHTTSGCSEEVTEVLEKESKKKKRKKNKDLNSSDVNSFEIESEDKNKENKALNLPIMNNLKPKIFENDKLFTAIKNIEECHSKLYPKEDEDELEAMKSKVLNSLKEHFPVNMNGVSDGRIKKRKRIRIRKSKKSNQLDIIHSDSDSSKTQINSSILLTNGKKSSHIRFNGPENPVNILQNEILENVDKTPRIIRAIQTNNTLGKLNSPTNSNQIDKSSDISDRDDFDECENTCMQMSPANKKDTIDLNDDKDLKIVNIVKHIDLHPIVGFSDTKESAVILFKMLKIGEDYTPTVSNAILGRVLNVVAESHLLKLFILDGHKECKLPSGKFDLDESDGSSADNTMEVTWDQMLEPRIIHP